MPQLVFIRSILFLEGMAALCTQILYSRIFEQSIGINSYFIAIILVCFLTGLSIGYHFGARINAQPLQKIGYSFLALSVLICLSLTPPVIKSVFSDVTSQIGVENTVLLYGVVVIVPTAILFGAIYPLCLKLQLTSSQTTHIEATSGDSLSISTIGNVVGSLFMIFFLLPDAGTALTVSIISGVLLVAGIMILLLNGKKSSFVFITAPCLLIVVAGFVLGRASLPSLIAHESTLSAEVEVHKGVDGSKTLEFNGLVMSYIDKYGKNSAWYINRFYDAVNEESIKQSKSFDILVIGAGGFLAGEGISSAHRLTYVDIEPELKDISEKHFLKKKVNGKFVVADARQYLLSTDKKWDVIMLDAFTGSHSIPEHLATKEFYKLLHRALTPSGRLYINQFLTPSLSDKFSNRIMYTRASYFPFCLTTMMDSAASISSVFLDCPKTQVVNPYIDDKPVAGYDYQELIAKAWESL